MNSKNAWIDLNPDVVSTEVRLFCFPYAGGSSSVFREWPTRFPDTIDICPIHLPGRGKRFSDTLIHNIDQIAEEAAKAMLPYLDLPYILFGHSMGATVAFEVAQRIQKKRALGPRCLIVSGRRAPHTESTSPPIHKLPDHLFIEEVLKMNGTSDEILKKPEVINLVLPFLRADFEAIETYRPSSSFFSLNCRIVALGGKEEKGSAGSTESWRRYSKNGFRKEIVPGDHFFLRGKAERFFEILNEELSLISTCMPATGKKPFANPESE